MRTADAELVARCRMGETGAFEELYRQHASAIYNLACRMLASDRDAEDVVQEVFLTAYQKLHGFKGDAALRTWLYRLGINQCLDVLRSKSAKRGQATKSIEEEQDFDRMPTARVRPSDTASRVDLERAIELLPEGCRAAFLLHDVEGFEHRQIADMLGIAEGTSKSQVHKARLRIREYLTGYRP